MAKLTEAAIRAEIGALPPEFQSETEKVYRGERCSYCDEPVNVMGRAIDGGLHPGLACHPNKLPLVPGLVVFVDAHREHGEDFSGVIVRINGVFVEVIAPDGETYVCISFKVYPASQSYINCFLASDAGIGEL